MRALILTCGLFWVVLASCARCTTSGLDAGLKRATDLRTALVTVFPENRGVAVKGGSVRLTRTVRGPADFQAEFGRSLAHNGFSVDDGGRSGTRAPYTVTFNEGPDGSGIFTVELPLDAPTVERLFNAPFAISTGELGLFLPKGNVTHEDFELALSYWAREPRAAFLSRQVVELNLGNLQWTHRGLPDAGWEPRRPDGGLGAVPDQFEVTLDSKPDDAVLWLKRDGKSVDVRYRLVTDTGPR